MGGNDQIQTVVRARMVLNDCREVLRHLRKDPPAQEWRILWVAALALLRTVQEALQNVDRKNSNIHPRLEEEIGAFHKRLGQTKPEPMIYWHFIRDNANEMLHEYKLKAVMVESYAPAVVLSGPSDVSTSATAVVSTVLRSTPGAGETARSYWMKNGPFKDQDQRDVIQKAIDWWEAEIGGIEERAQTP